MTVNERLAIEIGRAIVRALTAEAQRDEALTKLAAREAENAAEKPARKPKTAGI